MNRILKAESWQIFGIIVIPFIAHAFLPEKFLEVASPYFLTFFYWITFGWPLIVGYELNKKLPIELRKNLTILIISGLYTIFISTLIAFYNIPIESQNLIFGVKEILIVFSLLTIFYILYFSASTLRKLEKKRNVTFDEYKFIGFLFFINIIGVWFLQPRIRNVIENPDYKENKVK